MTNYWDFRVWKEVRLSKEQVALNDYVGYEPEELYELFKTLIAEAEADGLKGCYLNFSSSQEPYEDFLGPVLVTACGFRKLNEEELAKLEEEDMIEKLAKEMRVSIPEARTVYSLKQRGKL